VQQNGAKKLIEYVESISDAERLYGYSLEKLAIIDIPDIPKE